MKHDKQRRTPMLLGLAALAMVVTATPGYAAPVRFDNPEAGHFEWFGGEPEGFVLNVTLPASSQPGTLYDPGAFLQDNGADWTQVAGGTGGDLQVGGTPAVFLVGVNAGEPIPSGFAWDPMGYTNYPGYEDQTQLVYDEPTYLGVRFDPGDGTHYGWIGVVWASADLTLDAFAWGYETEVGVPIEAGIPEPGSLVMLAVGAAALASRRRRSAQ